MSLPEKFVIPKERMPRAWSQGVYNCCVAASITKVLEVMYKKRLSVGYTYGKHSRPEKTQGGMGYDYAMESLLKCGSVPEEMFPDIDEIPDIINKVTTHPNAEKLNKEAEKTKIKSYTKIKGDVYFYDNVKKMLYEKQMPLVGNMVGKRHCTVIVGWDGNKLLYHDHKGNDKIYKGRFNEAYYFEICGEENNMKYKLMNTDEFKNYIDSLKVSRKITAVQLHHTYSPAYSDFNGSNHLKLQEGMRIYHIGMRGYSDIAQNFTIFPDGKICTGRDINTVPAGIYGANATGICIECVGNFDKGGDVMADTQKNAIVTVCRTLLGKFGLDAKTGVTYHAWWTSGGTNLGDYIAGKSAKTCPGTNFFGGNTRKAYEEGLMKMLENKTETLAPVTEINDIVWELSNAGIITDGKLWIKKCEEDINVYWLCRKMANKLRGTM